MFLKQPDSGGNAPLERVIVSVVIWRRADKDTAIE